MALNITVLIKQKKWLTLFVVTVVVVVGLYFVLHRPPVKQSSQKRETGVVAAVKKTVTQSYYFHGQIKPIESSALLSPVNGMVQSIYFKYGAKVVKGEKLFTLSSKTLRDKFNQDLDGFLQKKDAYALQKESFQGTKALYDKGVVSKDEYLTQQNAYNSSELAYIEAKLELEKVLAKVNIDPKQVENMSYQDDEKIKKLFHDKFSNITVVAPVSGVALFPLPTESKNGDQLQKAQVGSDVKEGQLLLSIGDLSGFRADLKVNEIQINKIKSGQPVSITGEGFPGIILKGVVDRVALQSSPNDSSDSSSLFDVSVKAPSVSLDAQKIIHVGMTCQVKLGTQTAPMVLLPMAAIKHSLVGKNVVDLDTSSGKKTVTVMTGITTPSGEIQIVSGVKQGDKVYVYH